MVFISGLGFTKFVIFLLLDLFSLNGFFRFLGWILYCFLILFASYCSLLWRCSWFISCICWIHFISYWFSILLLDYSFRFWGIYYRWLLELFSIGISIMICRDLYFLRFLRNDWYVHPNTRNLLLMVLILFWLDILNLMLSFCFRGFHL